MARFHEVIKQLGPSRLSIAIVYAAVALLLAMLFQMQQWQEESCRKEGGRLVRLVNAYRCRGPRGWIE